MVDKYIYKLYKLEFLNYLEINLQNLYFLNKKYYYYKR